MRDGFRDRFHNKAAAIISPGADAGGEKYRPDIVIMRSAMEISFSFITIIIEAGREDGAAILRIKENSCLHRLLSLV